MNPAELLRLRLQSLLARGLGATRIREWSGLEGASEVWGGDQPRDLPAWYLWLRGRVGAWQIELRDAGPLGTAGGGAVAGRFAVRYYPPPGHPDLRSFSREEQDIAAGWLDATGAPHIELASRIPETAFTVGSIEWAVDLETDASVVGLASLDRLRQRRAAPGGGAGPGDLERDVPGWRLAAPAFGALASLYAQVERRAASRLVLARRPGFELLRSGEEVSEGETSATVQGEAYLVFGGADGAGAAAARLLDALLEPGAEGMVDEALAPGAHPHAVDLDPRLPLEVSHAWFGGEAHRQDRIACAC